MIKELFDGIQVFDSPKPIELIWGMMIIALKDDNAIALDFFSVLHTKLHRLMQRMVDFINLLWLSFQTDEKSEAYKAGL